MDHSESLQAWSEIRATEPNRLDAFLRPAVILRDLNRFDEAEALLLDAKDRFSRVVDPLVELAWLAHHARKWDNALDWWRRVRGEFAHPVGYLGAVKTLEASGRHVEAYDLLSDAFERFHDHRDTVSDHAWIAVHRGRWREGLVRFQNAIRQFPGTPMMYAGFAFCLRKLRQLDEAEACLADACSRFPEDKTLLRDWASTAFERSDWSGALARADLILSRWPEQLDGYRLGILSLIEMHRYEEAEARSAAAISRFPDVADFQRQYAAIAARRGGFDQAVERYEAFREQFPNDPRGYTEAAALFIQQSKFDEARNILKEGCRVLPNEPVIRFDLAQIAARIERGKPHNLLEALDHIQILTTRSPEFERGHVLHLSILCDDGKAEQAEAISNQLLVQFPRSADIAVAHARIALACKQMDAAVDRFFRVVNTFSDNPAGYIGLSEALCRAGRFDEAETAIAGAMERFPRFRPIVHEYARVPTRRGDWPLALARWTEAERMLSPELLISTMIFEARMRMAELDSQTNVAAPASDGIRDSVLEIDPTPLSAEGSEEVTDRELVMQFESLGGALLGCEFGLFQRTFGAEPLGLLRWTEIRPDELTRALQDRFSGVGLPENTELRTQNTDKGEEYFTRDQNYFMAMHTFVYESNIPRAEALDKFCKRIQYLKRKILDDLQESNKIFVYKISMRNLLDAEIESLYQAIRLYGNNTLLYVRRSAPDKPPGFVEMIKPGLMIGYIDRFAINPEGVDKGIPIESWLGICRSAYRLWKNLPLIVNQSA